ncbi:hypothetical protein [Herbaspirillum camelliae]|uniref:hypothetical protein n=1 Tax=Herbaspirillum camelliae TaxID=1892903 RepID=UPI000AD129E1|nr:hypothetical protein [Herbaspirillum camelliae]
MTKREVILPAEWRTFDFYIKVVARPPSLEERWMAEVTKIRQGTPGCLRWWVM